VHVGFFGRGLRGGGGRRLFALKECREAVACHRPSGGSLER